MKVKPLKIKIKDPTPSAADRLYAKHQAIRKAKGLPDPSEYKKKLDAMKSEETELDEGLKKAIGAVATAAAMATSPHAHSAFVASPNIAVQQDTMKRDHERRAQQAKEREGHEASMKRGQEFPLASHDASKRAGNAAPLSDRSKKLLKKEAVNPKDMSNNPDNPEAGKYYSGSSKSVRKVTTIATPKNESVSGNMRTRRQPSLRTGVMSNVGDTNENIPHTPKTDKEKRIKAALDAFGDKMKAQNPKLRESNDAREYDYEGDMAKSDLRSIIHNAQQLHDMLDDNTNLPEWVQSKITLAEDYMSTVANYMRSEMKEEVKEPTGDLKKACWKGYTAVGMKMKNGRKVPNCVPIKEEDETADQVTTDNQKFPKKMSRKAQIVRSAAKKMDPEDQFQAKPVLDSDVNPQTNKQ